jgi:hypothetical protein
MNRSYSKIRHIQEANNRLEKRMLSEQENPELEENNPFKFSNGFDDYDFPEELKERLTGRGTDSDDSISRRLFKVTFEMGFQDQFDVILVNDDLEKTLDKAEELVGEFLNK